MNREEDKSVRSLTSGRRMDLKKEVVENREEKQGGGRRAKPNKADLLKRERGAEVLGVEKALISCLRGKGMRWKWRR